MNQSTSNGVHSIFLLYPIGFANTFFVVVGDSDFAVSIAGVSTFIGSIVGVSIFTGDSLMSRDACAVSGFVFVLRAFTHGNTPAAVCIAASLIALVKSSYSPFLYDS